MYTELLIAIPLLFIIINIAIIIELVVIRHKQYNYTIKTASDVLATNQRAFTLCNTVLITPIPKVPLLLTAIIPAYSEAKQFIEYKLNRMITIKNKLTTQYEAIYNYEYLFEYLSIHFAKYPNGELPKQPGTITYYDNKAQYTMNFYDATEPKIEKLVKPCMQLLKTKKTKQLDILTEANKIVKAKGRSVKPKLRVSDNKMLVEVK